MTGRTQGNIGAMLFSAVFIVAGVVVLYDTTQYLDRDSQVFPRAAATAMILAASLSLITEILRPGAAEGFGTGSWWRRVLLVASMLAACFLMPVTGFLPAALLAFGCGLISAMHDRWSVGTALIYAGSGLVLMLAFYALFKFVLKVPIP